MHKLIFLIILLFSMSACKNREYTPQDCDLIFQLAEATEFSKAITDATAHQDFLKFDHVGLVFVEDGQPKVIEASAKHGVTITSLQAFINDSPAGYVVKRATCNVPTDRIIATMKSHLGEPYDWSYLPNNGKMYCSELIYECFVDYNGEHIFHAKPMNFRNEKGEMPQFWIDLFNKMGEKIPEGVIGTNPNDLSKEVILEEVWQCINVK